MSISSEICDLARDAEHNGLTLRRLQPRIGAEVCQCDVRALTPEQHSLVRRALDAYTVLIFRRQQLSRADLVKFAGQFGPYHVPDDPERYKTDAPDYPQIFIVSNIKGENGKPIGSLSSGEVGWHSDSSYLANSPETSCLYAVEIPAEGGDTSVCNQAAAYESLPDNLRQRITGRLIKHDQTFNAAGSRRVGVEVLNDPRLTPGTLHPAVCRNPRSGRLFLSLGRRRNAYLDGMELADSEELLDALWTHVTRPEHIYPHAWRPGDLMVWDNRMTMHRRAPFDDSARRLMYHVRLNGEPPSGPGEKT